MCIELIGSSKTSSDEKKKYVAWTYLSRTNRKCRVAFYLHNDKEINLLICKTEIVYHRVSSFISCTKRS